MRESLEVDSEFAQQLRRQESMKEVRRSTLKSYQSGQLEKKRRSMQEIIRNFVVSCPWLCVQAAMLIVDMVFLFMTHRELITNAQTLALVIIIVNVLYWCDMALRIYGFGPSNFFAKGWNIFDLIVIVLSTVGAILSTHAELRGAGVGRIARIFRVIRMIRLTTLGRRASAGLCDCMRLITGENKKRFIDAEEDFNLDVTYITPRLIGMSVPASGWLTALYRNPLSEVVRFLEMYHQGEYLIVNACPELPYPSESFLSGEVHCFNVQDHTPPTLEHFVSFLTLVQPWMSGNRGNVLVVHCRGGKGRTGSFCCAWLLYTRKAEDAEDALTLFAMQRTDIENTKIIKLQGVETPSQVRYVEYMEEVLHSQQAYFPAPILPVSETGILLQSLSVNNLFKKPKEIPEELVVSVHNRKLGQIVYWSGAMVHNSWNLANTAVRGDVRISVFDKSKLKRDSEGDGIAGKEPGCMFYFMIHTSFLHGGSLKLPMAKIDKAWKKPKLYNDTGFAELTFTPAHK